MKKNAIWLFAGSECVTMVESSVSLCQQLLLKPPTTNSHIGKLFCPVNAQPCSNKKIQRQIQQIEIQIQTQIQPTTILGNSSAQSMLSKALIWKYEYKYNKYKYKYNKNKYKYKHKYNQLPYWETFLPRQCSAKF